MINVRDLQKSDFFIAFLAKRDNRLEYLDGIILKCLYADLINEEDTGTRGKKCRMFLEVSFANSKTDV